MNYVHDFDELVNRRGTDSKKYSFYPEDVLPMWIADSDFKAPQPVVEALVKRMEHGVYGYTPVSGRLREAGAREVHFCVTAPPFIAPCYFGTDIPDREKLIACRHTVEEIRELTGADSLTYLSLENLRKIAPDAGCGFCEGCFTERYPLQV